MVEEHIRSLLFGLGEGGVFAALAVALVLTYRSSGVINFATGAIALFGTYMYEGLRNDGELLIIIPGLPTSVDIGDPLGFVPALVTALALTAVLGGVLYLLVFRPLREAPQLARAVASLGVLVVLQALMSVRWGQEPVAVKPIFPVEPWQWGDLLLLSDRFYLALTVVVVTLCIVALYRWTRFGLSTRAAAESQTGAFVSGISPDRVALLNWMVSAAVAGAAGILIAPIVPVTPITYTLYVVPALAAAVVGGFQHLVPTVIAGLAIGMLRSEALNLAADNTWLPRTGSSELVPLVVILAALLIAGRAIPVRGGLVRQPLGRAPRPRSLLLPTVVGLAVGLGFLLLTEGAWRGAVIGSFIAAIIGLSFVVVTGYAGQVSVAQLALAGCAAFTLSFLTVSWGVPFPLAPFLAALAATAVGVIVSLPALRLRGLTLGIVTLALAYAIEAVWFRNTQIVDSSGARILPPDLFGIDLGIGSGNDFPRIEFGLVCLFTLALVAIGVAMLRRSRFGSAMLAVRANERSAAGMGVNVTLVKIVSFAIASFIAGIGGSLLAYRRGIVSFDSFTAIGGLALLATAYLAGITSVYGGIFAGAIAAGGIIFFALDRWVDLGSWFTIVTGALLVTTVIRNPEGLAAGGHKVAELLARFRHRKVAPTTATVEPAPAVPALEAGRTLLAVDDLTVRYGGVTAVDDVSLQVPSTSVVGLIGPNGAGKTSVIDAITGFAAAEGRVTLLDESLDGVSPHVRVRRGLARTFQSLELYDDLTVEENVSVAVFGTDADERRGAIERALDVVGISELRERHAGELSQGERQLVSIARACAASPRVLLLDEPAAGLDPTESRWLGERIRGIAATGTGVLLVDHDVGLVLEMCDHIYVLDFGKIIAEGDATTIRADRTVADAYLGTTHSTVESSPEVVSVEDAPTTPSATTAAP
jgi:sulfate-transporting ATPase